MGIDRHLASLRRLFSTVFRSGVPFSRATFLSFLLLALMCSGGLVSGCSWFSSEPEEPAIEEDLDEDGEEDEEDDSDDADDDDSDGGLFGSQSTSAPALPTGAGSIEILWQVPVEAVDTYHLTYGLEETELSEKVSLEVQDLEKIDHPDHGPLFRYVIPNVPENKDLFFSIQAENQHGLSDPSPVQRIPVQKPAGDGAVEQE